MRALRSPSSRASFLLLAYLAFGVPFPGSAHGQPGAPGAIAVSEPASGKALRVTGEDFRRLPRKEIRTAVPWVEGVRRYEGVLARDLLRELGATGTTVRAKALNDYVVEIPVADFERYDVLVVDRIDGQPVPVRKNGPYLIMYPFDQRPELRGDLHYARCIWQLASLEIR